MTIVKSALASAAIIFALGATGAIVVHAAGETAKTEMEKKSAAPADAKAKLDAKAKPEKSAKSKECSARADGESLHGKARKKFRKVCMKKAA